MANPIYHLDEQTLGKVDRLARQDHVSPERVIADAVEFYRRQRILEETNAAYAAMRADPEASAAFDAECAAMNGTMQDGLVDDARPIDAARSGLPTSHRPKGMNSPACGRC